MSVLSTMGNMTNKALNSVSKIINPPKKSKPPVSKNFISESPEEYAQRLVQRRNQRH